MTLNRLIRLTIAAGLFAAAAASAQPAIAQPASAQAGEGRPGGTAPPAPPPSTPPWQAATPWPDRIVVTLDDDPATSFAVTWRTHADVEAARAEIVPAADHSRFDIGAVSVEARTEKVAIDRKTVDGVDHPLRWNEPLDPPAYHSVSFSGLEPDTLYAYRVMGAEGHWSEWFQTRTAPARGTPFRFLYFGDAQDGISSHWPRVVRAAFASAPDARFAVHAGDLVNIGSRDFEWAAWFRSVGFIHGMIPALPAVGNHEYFDGLRGDDGLINALSVLWRPQFTLPREAGLPDALQETVYSVKYGDVFIAVLDTMAAVPFELQTTWLDRALGEAEEPWKIVAMHHPMFELLERAYGEEGGPERREFLLPVLERHGVDLVLQGHDHSYGRGATYGGPRQPVAERTGDLGTVFVTSSAGAKVYEVSEQAWSPFEEFGASLAVTAENTPFFQVISVDGDALKYEARTSTGRLYDAFRLEKQRMGANRLVELPTDFDEPRRFDNTGPYENARYDQVPPLPAE